MVDNFNVDVHFKFLSFMLSLKFMSLMIYVMSLMLMCTSNLCQFLLPGTIIKTEYWSNSNWTKDSRYLSLKNVQNYIIG